MSIKHLVGGGAVSFLSYRTLEFKPCMSFCSLCDIHSFKESCKLCHVAPAVILVFVFVSSHPHLIGMNDFNMKWLHQFMEDDTTCAL